ncbi:FxsB family cyclophane-forming radical SAM/SPASM peptide maturase [Streptosporangium sp. NBC_01756]|uniref:FxsB family cyclophane-forming radical SAM/SPASM peptide maturase n=1 Tax=Streptosporangium sp. NBC_01756 TaxID=2975950 RepID=UPI002DD7CF6A|nr:FxsB family cyclophane-forming radical SAM/SPASM peptide maturase [Streptosporangium sp. NBC_01756]WSC84163.1 FxsB family radical SAM/SPASM domain protein [Streptosporangium sp. NBC_01756]
MSELIQLAVSNRKEWPESGLDVAALRAGEWQQPPFDLFIVKIHERCNLACTYCYMYEMADQSWLGRPMAMAGETIDALARRISEHVDAHDLKTIYVVLHGGEPLLAGPDMIDHFVRTVRDAVEDRAEVRFKMQTNGLLLDERMLGVLLAHDVRIGVSLDGGVKENDRSRKYRNGRGSYSDVARAMELLGSGRFRRSFSGFLCAIDLRNDPIECYEALAEFSPPAIDFMLPHANWTTPPPRAESGSSPAPYADWLIRIYEYWRKNPDKPKVRFFQNIFRLSLGGPSTVEYIGLSPVRLVVIDTDGSLQQADSLKSTFPGAPETGLNVFEHSFDTALDHPAVIARQIGASGLSATCQACAISDVCGGGHYTHRYRSGSGFLNPSVYCADLMRLVTHIQQDMRRELLADREASDA